MKFIIFEDSGTGSFYPFSITKPLWEMRSGMFSFRERIILTAAAAFPGTEKNSFHFFTRDYLVPLYREKYPQSSINEFSVFNGSPDDFFFINATINSDIDIFAIPENCAILCNGVPLAARIGGNLLNHQGGSVMEILGSVLERADVLKKDTEADSAPLKINYPWDLIFSNAERIIADYEIFLACNPKKNNNLDNNSVTIIGDRGQVYIEDSVSIDPFVVIDATKGPVIIREGTVIHSFSRLEGPLYIGRDCVVLGAKLREGTSIGDNCRIGGEIEESIFHGFSNKYHDGFIGHSYVGEWVNMGALTTNSDLKNNYQPVKVYIPKKRVNTGLAKVGAFIGDFVKTSIGTLINTGASIGTGSMLVFNGAMTPYHIPPFAWFLNSQVIEHEWLDDFLEICSIMMARRGETFTPAYRDLIKKIYLMKNDFTGK